MIEYRNLRVALLGAGAVGSQVADAAARARRRARQPGRREPRARRHRRARPRTRRATSSSRSELFTTDARIADPRRRHRHRADGRHRAGAQLPAARAQLGGRCHHRQQGAARHPRPRALRGRRAGRRAALLRGGRRRRDPDHPPAARQPRGRPGAPHPRHRQRHDELHPRPHGREGDTLEDALADGDRARLRRSRPDRRHRGVRRGAEGRDPREPRLPHHGSARARCYREGITAITRAQVDVGAQGRLRRQAARRSASAHRSARPGSRASRARVLSRADPPRRIRSPPCTAPTTRCSSRPRPRAT